jgi:hypothetical protein
MYMLRGCEPATATSYGLPVGRSYACEHVEIAVHVLPSMLEIDEMPLVSMAHSPDFRLYTTTPCQ